MTKNKQIIINVLRIAIPVLITVLWLGFIYSNSLKSGEESGAQSGQVHKVVNEVAQGVGIEKPISEHLVRKSAHFIEFAVLGLFICADIWALRVAALTKKLYVSAPLLLCSVPVCALLASVDEFLQRFSDSRGPSLKDVLLDTSGSAAATVIFIFAFIIIYCIYKKIKLNNKSYTYEKTDC